MFRDAVLAAAGDAIARLGEAVILPDASEVQGIFKFPTELAEITRGKGSAIEVPAVDPVLHLLDADASALVRGSTLMIRGKSFDVVDLYPSGSGTTKLTLAQSQQSDQDSGAWR